jgi:hypothetical protein
MRSRVEEVGPAVLEALRAGCSVATAAAAGGVAEDTVRTWIKTGRRQPDGRLGVGWMLHCRPSGRRAFRNARELTTAVRLRF